jgi:transposase
MEPFDPLKHVPEHVRLGKRGPTPPKVPNTRQLPDSWTRVLCLTQGLQVLNCQFDINEDMAR